MTARGVDFAALSRHDCRIRGIEPRTGDARSGDWTGDIAHDIDFIVERVRGSDGDARFRVAPANLTLHGVTDLSIAVAQELLGAQIALHPWSVDQLARMAVADRKVVLGRRCWRWVFAPRLPKCGNLAFGARDFTRTLRADPVLTERQHLALLQRTTLAVD